MERRYEKNAGQNRIENEKETETENRNRKKEVGTRSNNKIENAAQSNNQNRKEKQKETSPSNRRTRHLQKRLPKLLHHLRPLDPPRNKHEKDPAENPHRPVVWNAKDRLLDAGFELESGGDVGDVFVGLLEVVS